MRTQTAYFERFKIGLTKSDAASASHSGDCASDVEALCRKDYILRQLDGIPAETLAAELKEYGAWDAEELADNNANRERIIWLAAGNIMDETR